MSSLRQRQTAGKAAKQQAPSAVVAVDAAPVEDQLDADDDAPVVAEATSAFDEPASAEAAPPAPAAQSMDDGDADGEGEVDADGEPKAFVPLKPHNGSKLALPANLRSVFERKKDELIQKYPDLMTRDLSEGPAVEDDEGVSIRCRFDLVIVALFLCVLSYVAYVEYEVNVLALVGGYVQRMLDPGPIQRNPPFQPDENIGRAAVEEAVRAVKERMKAT